MNIPLKATQAKAGRLWAGATIAPFVAAQAAAVSLFGHNERLLHDVLAAPGVSLFVAVGLGALATKFNKNPDIARYAVAGVATGLGIVAAVGIQHNLEFNGVQDGIAAIPSGEMAVIVGGAAAAAVAGEATGRALMTPTTRPAPKTA